MCEKKRIDILREEVVIPKEVQQKADAAFEQILAKPGGRQVAPSAAAAAKESGGSGCCGSAGSKHRRCRSGIS